MIDKSLAHYSLEYAIKCGATAARVSLGTGDSLYMTLLDGEMESIQKSATTILSLQIYKDGRYGSFTSSGCTKENIKTFISRAVDSVSLLSVDECRALPPREVLYKKDGFDLDLYDESLSAVSLEQKKELLYRTAAVNSTRRSDLISFSDDYQESVAEEYVIDSEGLEAENRQTECSLSTECTVSGEGDAKPQNWWMERKVRFSSLKGECGNIAYARAAGMKGRKKIKSGLYPVIIENTVSSRMVNQIISALSGSAIQQGNSFLADSLGKKLFPETLTISDRPHLRGCLGSGWYDTEGIATADTDIIRNGTVNAYRLGSFCARKMKLPVTPLDTNVLCFPINDGMDAAAMMKQIGRGIFITDFNGGNCNGTTGDFSYGIDGFWFENGSIVHPIKEMNITGNILSLWNSITYIGNDPLESRNNRIPALAFGAVQCSGL